MIHWLRMINVFNFSISNLHSWISLATFFAERQIRVSYNDENAAEATVSVDSRQSAVGSRHAERWQCWWPSRRSSSSVTWPPDEQLVADITLFRKRRSNNNPVIAALSNWCLEFDWFDWSYRSISTFAKHCCDKVFQYCIVRVGTTIELCTRQ